MNFFLDVRIDHDLRPPAVGTEQLRCGAKQATDQGALFIHFTAIFSQMRAAQIGQRRIAFLCAFIRQPRHLLSRGRHRAAAIVTAGYAGKLGYPPSEKSDFLAIACHGLSLFLQRAEIQQGGDDFVCRMRRN